MLFFGSEASAKRARSYQNEEVTIAIDELRKRPADRAWFIPICLSPGAVPRRPIGGGEYLTDLQWVDLHSDWEGGLARLLKVIAPHETLTDGEISKLVGCADTVRALGVGVTFSEDRRLVFISYDYSTRPAAELLESALRRTPIPAHVEFVDA